MDRSSAASTNVRGAGSGASPECASNSVSKAAHTEADGVAVPLSDGCHPAPSAASSRGSMKVGPSDDYLALLRGEITSEEYVERLKARVDERFAQEHRFRRKPMWRRWLNV